MKDPSKDEPMYAIRLGDPLRLGWVILEASVIILVSFFFPFPSSSSLKWRAAWCASGPLPCARQHCPRERALNSTELCNLKICGKFTKLHDCFLLFFFNTWPSSKEKKQKNQL